MKNKTVWILVLVVLFAILLIQNSKLTELRFYFWPMYAPLFILIFFIFLIGFLVGFLAAKSGHRKDKKELVPPPPPAAIEPPLKLQS